MANHKSAIKKQIQSQKKRIINKSFKNKLITQKKKTLIEKKEINEFNNSIQCKKEISLIHKSIKKGIYHKNKAAKKISKLMKSFNLH
jgi:small subunit ribosomal protein S20